MPLMRIQWATSYNSGRSQVLPLQKESHLGAEPGTGVLNSLCDQDQSHTIS